MSKNKMFEKPEKVKDAVAEYMIDAMQGNAEAQYYLAECFADGLGGLNENQKVAFEWYKMAVDLNHPGAIYAVALYFQDGDVVEQNLDKALLYIKKSANLGDSSAQLNLSYRFQNGDGVEKNEEKAFDYAVLAAKADEDGCAFYHLGDHYCYGIGTNIDYKKAFDYYWQAKEKGLLFSLTSLGWMYEQGLGVNVDRQKAFELYMEAASQGDCSGQFHLGMWYFYKDDDQETDDDAYLEDWKQAFKWYKLAAENEDTDDCCCSSLAECYEYGYGVERNIIKAIEWYRKAAELGNAEALKKLDKLSKI